MALFPEGLGGGLQCVSAGAIFHAFEVLHFLLHFGHELAYFGEIELTIAPLGIVVIINYSPGDLSWITSSYPWHLIRLTWMVAIEQAHY